MDELDEIRRDARTAQTLREGANGSQAGQADLQTRLNGGDPAAGRALRAQPPADMNELRGRLTASQPQMPLRETIERAAGPDPANEVRGRLTANQPQVPLRDTIERASRASQAQVADRLASAPTQPAAAPAQPPAVPPRNVPLGTPVGTGPAPGTIAVDSGGNAGVVRNPSINPNVRGGMSPEAEQFLKERAATPGSSGVKGATAAAAEAAPAARTISGVARAAGPLGLAASGVIEGRDVARVAQDPNRNAADVATQAGESMAKVGAAGLGAYYGGVAGAGVGAMTGPAAPVAVPALATIGAVAGGIAGPKAVGDVISAGREGISKLRGMFGLAPKDTSSPAEGAVPQYERDRAAKGGDQPGPNGSRVQAGPNGAVLTQRPNEQAGTGVQQVSGGVPKTIAGAAQQAQGQPQATKTPVVDYKLGTNAVEVFNGAESHVQLFGPNGERSSVPTNVFQAGPQAIARYGDEVRAAQARALEDPNGQLARQRLENEGRVATQEKANEGHIAGVREQLKTPVPIKDGLGNTTALATPQPGGEPRITEMPGPKPALAKAHADAKAAVKQGADPAAVNRMLDKWGYPSLNFGNK